ncbi:Dabb family protein [Mesorhizobium sp.]|uniref:Dabb family protein n=1 Tax=Mesorhizobium sp. TaxID=1871066 RepID=UPI000FEA3F5A|nr:Dabb family protein [Mesorhizobium sp.]RWF83659.1 MAG: Dabb family protein [Mesorhizobium sp.]RWF88510.1 MAG: Dabb family protein [Mesorhizobium sp.]TIM54114.1 MAG: Dabb family protein [Mesorhizobium sp.]
MIRHIVFFTAASNSNLEPILDGLALLTKIPHARRLEVAPNRRSDPASKEIDVVVYGEFDSDAELAAYKAHPLYQEAIKRVRPLRELRFAADYEIATAKASMTSAGSF